MAPVTGQEKDVLLEGPEVLVVKPGIPQVHEGPRERGETVLVLTSEALCSDEPVLGELLLRNMIYALVETVPAPRAVILVGTAVRLAGGGSAVLESVRTLERQGVRVLLCSTSLEYLGVTPQAGVPTNVYHIVETLLHAKKTIVF